MFNIRHNNTIGNSIIPVKAFNVINGTKIPKLVSIHIGQTHSSGKSIVKGLTGDLDKLLPITLPIKLFAFGCKYLILPLHVHTNIKWDNTKDFFYIL